jgi:hypothetical protein
MTRLVTACAAEGTSQHAFDLARRAAGRPWHAERARIEVLASRELLDIYTGEPDWDAAFALSQTAAARLLYPGSSHLPHVSFVRSRQPDGGYSRAGDGSDYPPSWNGQTPLETCYLAGQLPLAAGLVQGFLKNFISVQKDDGGIDGKPGLAGQRSKFLATPMLASLAWRSYQVTQDLALLEGTFTQLLAFFQSWFSQAHDRDGDGIPEWEHIQQTAFEDNPLFDVWYPWSQSLSISSFSSPELEALLAGEAASLIQIAEALGRADAAAALRLLIDRLTSSIEAAWNPKTSLYSYRDLATGASCAGKPLASRSGPGELSPRKAEFEKPMRLLIQVEKRTQAAGSPEMEISGWGGSRSTDKLAESIEAKQFRWHAVDWWLSRNIPQSRPHIDRGLGNRPRRCSARGYHRRGHPLFRRSGPVALSRARQACLIACRAREMASTGPSAYLPSPPRRPCPARMPKRQRKPTPLPWACTCHGIN